MLYALNTGLKPQANHAATKCKTMTVVLYFVHKYGKINTLICLKNIKYTTKTTKKTNNKQQKENDYPRCRSYH